MLREFKEFAMRGSVLTPPLGLLIGPVDFANLFINLSGQGYPTLVAAEAAGAPTLNYGAFLGTVTDFAIVAFALFLLIRQVNRLRRREEAPAPPATRDCPHRPSPMPRAARRCAHCTFEVGGA